MNNQAKLNPQQREIKKGMNCAIVNSGCRCGWGILGYLATYGTYPALLKANSSDQKFK